MRKNYESPETLKLILAKEDILLGSNENDNDNGLKDSFDPKGN